MMPIAVMVMIITVLPPWVVRIIIAPVEANSSIAAAAGNQESQTAEDQANSSDHGVYSLLLPSRS
jgi:hypothetical protein